MKKDEHCSARVWRWILTLAAQQCRQNYLFSSINTLSKHLKIYEFAGNCSNTKWIDIILAYSVFVPSPFVCVAVCARIIACNNIRDVTQRTRAREKNVWKNNEIEQPRKTNKRNIIIVKQHEEFTLTITLINSVSFWIKTALTHHPSTPFFTIAFFADSFFLSSFDIYLPCSPAATVEKILLFYGEFPQRYVFSLSRSWSFFLCLSLCFALWWFFLIHANARAHPHTHTHTRHDALSCTVRFILIGS